jgi:hypothetical protein
MRSAWLVVTIASLCSAGMLVGAGCSSSSNNNHPTTDGGGDVMATDTGPAPDVVMDAGPDNEQDPNVYPSKHQPIAQIDFLGGPVLQHPKIVTVTFTGYPHTQAMRAFDHNITSTGWWGQATAGYCTDDAGTCVGMGSADTADGGGFWHPDGSTDDAGDGFYDVDLAYDFASMGIDDQADIQPWLAKHIMAGDFPQPTTDSLYALYFPSTVAITLFNSASCAQFGGYHNSANVNGQQVAYAVMPLCSTGSMAGDYMFLTITASHEFAEAATDPHPESGPTFYLQTNDAWGAQNAAQGGECGDMCENVNNNTYDESGWTVQRIWSNLAAAQSKNPCQPWSKPYFAAAVRTPETNYGGHPSYGYVAVKRGQSIDVIADVFSETALSADLLLYAGIDKGAGFAPEDMKPMPDNLVLSLSKMQVHNGNAVDITLTAPTSAATGDYHFAIRAVLQGTDYNDWPVIAHVQ